MAELVAAVTHKMSKEQLENSPLKCVVVDGQGNQYEFKQFFVAGIITGNGSHDQLLLSSTLRLPQALEALQGLQGIIEELVDKSGPEDALAALIMLHQGTVRRR